MSTNNSLKTTGNLKAVDGLQVKSSTAANPRGLISDQYGATTQGARLHLRKARGTEALPTAVQIDDGLGIVCFNGYGDTSFGVQVAGSASIGASAAETWTDTAQGASLVFRTTTSGTATAEIRMVIGNDGAVGLGSNSNPYLSPFSVNPYGALTINTIASPALAITPSTGQAIVASSIGSGFAVQFSSANATGTALELYQSNPSGSVLRLTETSGIYKVGFKVPTLPNNYTLTLPVDAGISGQFLQTGIGGALSWAAAGGGSPTWVNKNDTNDDDTLLSSETHIFVDTTSNAFKLYLPTTPSAGDTVTFVDAAGNCLTNALTIDADPAFVPTVFINDTLENIDLDQDYAVLSFVYTGSTWVWATGLA